MEILLNNEQRKFEVSKALENLVLNIIKAGIEYEKIKIDNIEISISFTNNRNIRKLNREYRNIDKITDVLSFPSYEKSDLIMAIKKYNPENGPLVLGDIIVSMEKVNDQAKEYGHSFERELGYMIVHSFLHLLGYDHVEEKDKNIMRIKEEKILEYVNLKRKQ